LARNITDPIRRREEGTSRDGDEDNGGAGGSPGGSSEDGGDVPVHAEPLGTAQGFASPPPLFPADCS
jgi:hypothetical protein